MNANKNLFISLAAVIGFMFLWNEFVVSRYAPPGEIQRVDDATREPSKDQPPTLKPRTFTPSDTESESEQTFLVKDENSRVQLGSRGGRVLSWQVRENGHWIELVAPIPSQEDEKARPPKEFPLTTFPELDFTGEKVSESGIVLTARHPAGFQVEKTFILNELPTPHDVTLQLVNTSGEPMAIQFDWGLGPGLHSATIGDDAHETAGPGSNERAVAFGENLRHWSPGFIFRKTIDRVEQGPFAWIGVDNNYFLSALFGVSAPIESVHVEASKKSSPEISIPIDVSLRSEASWTGTYRLYMGPKNLDWLRSIDPSLEEAVNFGMFGFLARILLASLEFLKSITGNYGWAIILLTICYQILVFPLTKRSLQHSVRMRQLQPLMKKIQEQFKSDPKRMQIETFNLYKRNGMRFMGMEGCFPMLVQIPFFLAIYSALQNSYQLRGAPWILWINNLAAPDPIYVLPVLMGIASFLQSKLTTVAMDPAQQKMMMFMPAFLVFIFLKMPSGLVLYWFVQSLATIVVQQILRWKKLHEPEPVS